MNVRTTGLLKIIGSGVGFAIVFLVVLKNGLGDPSHGGPFKLILMALPGAFALVGIIELFTGIEFGNVSKKWDELHSWQRGVLGVFIAIFSFVLMMAGVVLFA